MEQEFRKVLVDNQRTGDKLKADMQTARHNE